MDLFEGKVYVIPPVSATNQYLIEGAVLSYGL